MLMWVSTAMMSTSKRQFEAILISTAPLNEHAAWRGGVTHCVYRPLK
eukprot:COSAG01_NODE_9362_length_2470_cov_1.374947_2_plen_47_part_00